MNSIQNIDPNLYSFYNTIVIIILIKRGNRQEIATERNLKGHSEGTIRHFKADDAEWLVNYYQMYEA